VHGLEEQAQAADEKLAAARSDLKALAELGLSIDALHGFVHRLSGIAQRHGIKSGELRDRLLNDLETGRIGIGIASEDEAR